MAILWKTTCNLRHPTGLRHSLLNLLYTATHCNTLQLSATHCNSLQHTATHAIQNRNYTVDVWEFLAQAQWASGILCALGKCLVYVYVYIHMGLVCVCVCLFNMYVYLPNDTLLMWHHTFSLVQSLCMVNSVESWLLRIASTGKMSFWDASLILHQNFSIVSCLVIVYSKFRRELTFENV